MFPTRELLARLGADATVVKSPALANQQDQVDAEVVSTVSRILSDIEQGGREAVMRYAKQFDSFTGAEFAIEAATLESCGSRLPDDLRSAIEFGARSTSEFARAQRERLSDFEVENQPGVVAGVRHVPVGRVGAYLPAGQFPLTASAFMTVGVAKAAGVPKVLACTPPQRDGRANDAVLYAAHVSGVNEVYLLGGVQALAAMAFGLVGDGPVDMLVGAGNAYVAEAKRQLFGKTAIDILAGPSEVAVIADDSADAELVAADLLAQAEHGVNSPAALITTSHSIARQVGRKIQEQLTTLPTAHIAGAAWRDYGSIIVVTGKEMAVQVMDHLAPEHLELHTREDSWYHEHLTSYGSLFLGSWSTVAYSDKGMTGTNHVLPTRRGARHTAGLSVAKFLKPLTYQRVSREATTEIARAVVTISESESMAAHAASAQLRLARLE